MTLALDQPSPTAAFTQWTFQPMAAVIAALLIGYLLGIRRLRARGHSWPAGRTAVFLLGLVALAWTTCGFPQVYGSSLYWVWTTQTLVLWLAVPIVVLFGHPVQLARAVTSPVGSRRVGSPRAVPPRPGLIDRVLNCRAARIVGNPLVGPALVPLLSAVLFFGPLPGWSIRWAPFGWALQLVLLAVGALMVLPLVGMREEESSLAVGLALAIGCFELVLDALPGIVLRLRNTVATSWFAERGVHSWTPAALHDQHLAGAILWCVAEIIDLPFLVLVYRRWLRADARDAARVDAVLEAERTARRGLDRQGGAGGTAAPDAPDAPGAADRDLPWWLNDPAMQERLRRQG